MKRIWLLFAVLALLCALTIPALAAAGGTADAEPAAQTVSGMAMLRGLELPRDQVCWPEKQLRRGLALAYRRSRELWQAFQSWSASSEFGFSFRALARQEEAASTRLLALLANCPVKHT